MSRMSQRGLFIVALTLALLPWGVQGQSSEAIAVIVHPTNPINDLSLAELRRLYLGTITIFENGERVVLLEASEQRSRFYRLALNMGEDRLKRHWIGRVFAGESGSPPREIRSEDELLRYVATHPGAIAFIPAASVAENVKRVTIEGRGPNDGLYPIR